MLTMRITPKMSERPLARRKRSAPYETPLKSWVIQNSPRTAHVGLYYEGARESSRVVAAPASG